MAAEAAAAADAAAARMELEESVAAAGARARAQLQEEWRVVRLVQEGRRVAPDGAAYDLREFQEFYGGLDEWCAAPEEHSEAGARALKRGGSSVGSGGADASSRSRLAGRPTAKQLRGGVSRAEAQAAAREARRCGRGSAPTEEGLQALG